jgi:hypothetical protein
MIWKFEGENCTLIGKRKYRMLLMKLFADRSEFSTFIKNNKSSSAELQIFLP